MKRICILSLMATLLAYTFVIAEEEKKTLSVEEEKVLIENIEKRITYKQYHIQKRLSVPNVKIVGNGSIITYRTEVHNGTENAVLLIVCKQEEERYKPVLVLEELYDVSSDHYYIKKFSHIDDQSLTFSQFKFYKGKKEQLFTATVSYNEGNPKFKIVESLNDGDYEDLLIPFFESFDTVKNRIMEKDF